MQVNIKFLSESLNLAASTISKALRDSHEISDETKKRVLDFAARHNYVPNAYASSLRRRNSKTIALVLPEVEDSFFSVAINGIQSVAQQKGYHVLIYLTHENITAEQSIFKEFQWGRVDGVLLSVSDQCTDADHLRRLVDQRIPLVFFDRVHDNIDAAKVITDDFQSGYSATKHLLDKKCEKISFLSFGNKLAIIEQRLKGYEKALAEAGVLPEKSRLVVTCTNNEKQNYQLIEQLLTDHHPDAVLASVEKLAITTYKVCKNNGMPIPQHLKVLAFSNLQFADLLNPSLTTITQPAFEIGKTAAELLFKSLEKKNFILKNQKIIVPSILAERDSTATTQT